MLRHGRTPALQAPRTGNPGTSPPGVNPGQAASSVPQWDLRDKLGTSPASSVGQACGSKRFNCAQRAMRSSCLVV
jgi:hypothetical protein